jgi:hypothetical protein
MPTQRIAITYDGESLIARLGSGNIEVVARPLLHLLSQRTHRNSCISKNA